MKLLLLNHLLMLLTCCCCIHNTADAASLPTANATSGEIKVYCHELFEAMNVDLRDNSRYDTYFRNNSVVNHGHAGTYKGVENIQEYFGFVQAGGAVIRRTKGLFQHVFLKSVNSQDRTCQFIAYFVFLVETTPIAGELTLLYGAMVQYHLDYAEAYIPRVDVYFSLDVVDTLFGLAALPEALDFVCRVSEACPDTNVGMTHQECLNKLASLPLSSNDGSYTGNDLGCRGIHAGLALFNDEHCPHISFEPQKDANGLIKCQTPFNKTPLDFFEQEDIDGFENVMALSIIGSSSGLKILQKPKDRDPVRLGVLAIVVPLIVATIAFFLTREKKTKGDESAQRNQRVKSMVDRRQRQLCIIFSTALVVLAVVYGLGGLFIWIVSENHPDWANHNEDPPLSPLTLLQDSYFGEPLRVGETAPQSELSDQQFYVYLGFVLTLACLIPAMAIEVFVWIYLVQIWDSTRSALWKFTPFIFPFFLQISLGLAASGNYLSLLFLIIALFKLGFPEITMYLFLGFFSPESNALNRSVDLLYGFTILLHHSVCVLGVAMALVGVIRPNRVVFESLSILVLQHLFTAISYVNVGLYNAILIFLEYHFQWSVLSNFANIFDIHWTAALCAGVFVFDHWLFLIAALLRTFAKTRDNKSSVYERANKLNQKRMSVTNALSASMQTSQIHRDLKELPSLQFVMEAEEQENQRGEEVTRLSKLMDPCFNSNGKNLSTSLTLINRACSQRILEELDTVLHSIDGDPNILEEEALNKDHAP